jgi:hypothetical protein
MLRKYIAKKTLDFGKVDYNHTGRKANRVTVTLELYEDKDGPVFSATGKIWNQRGTDILCGGQCLDTIAEYVHGPKMREILRLWNTYHLNDMHPECEHQLEMGWRDEALQDVTLYRYTLKHPVLSEQRKVEREVIDTVRAGRSFTPTPEQAKLLGLPYSLDQYEPITGDLAEYYEPRRDEATKRETRGWIRYDENEIGILGKPCPVCGYKYGHGWKYMPIPDADIEIIKQLCV